ncbi:DUF961 family protein [Enterococcus sp. LJL128]
MAISFEKNIVPANPEKTLGNLIFVSSESREGFENGERTGEIVEQRVEVSSDVQQSTIRVVLPATTDVKSFKFGDTVELVEPTFMAWAMIDPEAYGNFADADVKVTAKDIKKKGGLRQQLNDKKDQKQDVPSI